MKSKINFEKIFKTNKNENINSIKIFLSLYKKSKLTIFLSLIFYTIKHSPVLIIPIITADLINILVNSEQNLNKLLPYTIFLTILLLQNIPFHILHISFLSKSIRFVESELRSSIVRKLQVLSIPYHKELQSGKLQTKVLRDVEAIELLSRQTSIELIPLIINTIFAITLTSMKSIIVSIFFIIAIPISIFLLKLFKKPINKTNKNFRKEIEEMSANVSEMIDMIPLTRAHALEEIEINRIENHLKKVKSYGYKMDLVNAIFGSSNWVIFQFFQVLCLLFTVTLSFNGKIPIGDVVMYQTFFTMVLNQISGIINVYPQIMKGMESIKSISEILSVENTETTKNKNNVKYIYGNIKFCNVSYIYPAQKNYLIKNFSLNISKGECIAFVGESGAGKTTLLNLLIGFLNPSEGKIYIDNNNLSHLNLRSYRKHIAVVPQNTILFSGTIKDNITYGIPSIKDSELEIVLEKSNLLDFINSLPEGIYTKIGENGNNLSGGQRQRISIARALIRDPKIIIFDEATSALDSISEERIKKAIHSLIKNKTTFIVAHRLSTISNADKIIQIKDGTFYEYYSYEEFLYESKKQYKIEVI